jgi:glutaminyl-peptide cyclotransferase
MKMSSLRWLWLLVSASAWLASACRDEPAHYERRASLEPATRSWTLVRAWPHDQTAFTQGLHYHDGFLYESTGLYGKSTLRKLDASTGRVIKKMLIPPRYFAEGIALVQDRLILLTWREQTGLVFDVEQFELLNRFAYDGEGWGLAYDGKQLIMSDGTARLRFFDPETFEPTGELTVMDGEQPLEWINELAMVEGELWANIWQQDRIACINLENGRVIAWLDMESLARQARNQSAEAEVMNGIAYDEATGRLWVTGKNWPVLYELRLE